MMADKMDQSSCRVQAGRVLPIVGFWLSQAGLVVGASGCGTNADALLLQAANAAGITVVDQLLTEIANVLAGTPEANDEQTPADSDPSSGGGDDSGDEASGDPDAGQDVFVSNNCAGCHCADGKGGCALNAPAIIGADAARLAGAFAETSGHPVKPVLSEQELADLAAYLDSL